MSKFNVVPWTNVAYYAHLHACLLFQLQRHNDEHCHAKYTLSCQVSTCNGFKANNSVSCSTQAWGATSRKLIDRWKDYPSQYCCCQVDAGSIVNLICKTVKIGFMFLCNILSTCFHYCFGLKNHISIELNQPCAIMKSSSFINVHATCAGT